MPDFVPPGAPAAGTLDITPDRLEQFAAAADAQSSAVGDVRNLTGLETAESSVPGAQLINGCIGFRQTVEPLIGELIDELSQLYLDVHAGLATVGEADVASAADIGRAGGR